MALTNVAFSAFYIALNFGSAVCEAQLVSIGSSV
jgi:hypothetical protein